jgi:hypothetical protein
MLPLERILPSRVQAFGILKMRDKASAIGRDHIRAVIDNVVVYCDPATPAVSLLVPTARISFALLPPSRCRYQSSLRESPPFLLEGNPLTQRSSRHLGRGKRERVL